MGVPSLETWTRDADGNPIRWNEPPYYVRGVVHLACDAEPLSTAEQAKRQAEFLALASGRVIVSAAGALERANDGPAYPAARWRQFFGESSTD